MRTIAFIIVIGIVGIVNVEVALKAPLHLLTFVSILSAGAVLAFYRGLFVIGGLHGRHR